MGVGGWDGERRNVREDFIRVLTLELLFSTICSSSQPAARAYCQEGFWSIFRSDPEIMLAEQVLEKLFSLELTAVHALTSGYHWNTCYH